MELKLKIIAALVVVVGCGYLEEDFKSCYDEDNKGKVCKHLSGKEGVGGQPEGVTIDPVTGEPTTETTTSGGSNTPETTTTSTTTETTTPEMPSGTTTSGTKTASKPHVEVVATTTVTFGISSTYKVFSVSEGADPPSAIYVNGNFYVTKPKVQSNSNKEYYWPLMTISKDLSTSSVEYIRYSTNFTATFFRFQGSLLFMSYESTFKRYDAASFEGISIGSGKVYGYYAGAFEYSSEIYTANSWGTCRFDFTTNKAEPCVKMFDKNEPNFQPRYGDSYRISFMRIGDFVYGLDDNKQIHKFKASTLFLDKVYGVSGLISEIDYLLSDGTDAYLVGWLSDGNLSFKKIKFVD